MLRHLYSVRSEEIDVVELMLTREKSVRRKLLTKIRNLGNHRFNSDVIRNGSGIIKVVHRPKKNQSARSSVFHSVYIVTAIITIFSLRNIYDHVCFGEAQREVRMLKPYDILHPTLQKLLGS